MVTIDTTFAKNKIISDTSDSLFHTVWDSILRSKISERKFAFIQKQERQWLGLARLSTRGGAK